MDLKTAFLQGEAYDETRDIICQIPPEYGIHPTLVLGLRNLVTVLMTRHAVGGRSLISLT